MPPIQDQITQLWGEITAATHRFLELIAELDRTEAWMGAGMVSCAQWLNLHCGIGEVAAREKLRVAHAVGKLPEINAAFRNGRVSYSKVRAMTRVATPENEHVLLNIALHGTASHVERTVRHFRRFERIEHAQVAEQTYRQRSVRFRYDEDDSVLISARLPAEIGELVKRAIERAAELANVGDSDATANCTTPDEPDFTFDAHSRHRAEGLRLMAEQFLADSDQASGGSSDRYQIVVHIDQRLLNDSPSSVSEADSVPEACCEIEDGPVLAIETARRLACDGSLVGIVADPEGTALNIGRKTRAIPHAIRRALKARDGGCRFPGCTHTRFTEGHHIQHWAAGGETRLENLVTLCHFHHHLVHEGGYGIRPGASRNAFIFTSPDGLVLQQHPGTEKCFRGNILAEHNRERGIEIEPGTVDTRWLGERMDYGMAIDGLIAARKRSQAGARSESPMNGHH